MTSKIQDEADRAVIRRHIAGEATAQEWEELRGRANTDRELAERLKQYYREQNMVEDLIASAVVLQQMRSGQVPLEGVKSPQEEIGNVIAGQFKEPRPGPPVLAIVGSVAALLVIAVVTATVFFKKDRIQFGPQLAVASLTRGMDALTGAPQTDAEAIQFSFDLTKSGDVWTSGEATLIGTDSVRFVGPLTLDTSAMQEQVLVYDMKADAENATASANFTGRLNVFLHVEAEHASSVEDIKDVRLTGTFASGRTIEVSWERNDSIARSASQRQPSQGEP